MKLFSVYSVVCFSILVIGGQFGYSAESNNAVGYESAIREQLPALGNLYKDLHRSPELAHQEKKTASRIAREFRTIPGMDVIENVGGFGVIGIVRNGKGPVGLLRAELDALPIKENTGLTFSSETDGVMHACGHDVNLSGLVGAAQVLVKLKRSWKGTVIFVAQPAEEQGPGAEALLKDRKFKKLPKADYALASHVFGDLPVGEIGYRSGYAMASTDSIDIKFVGKGGHGAMPHRAIDPIVLTSKFILELQTLISRELNPLDKSLVSIGSVHGGTAYNVIPDEVALKGMMRTFNDDSRSFLKKRIQELAVGASKTANAKPPTVRFSDGAPAVYNDPKTVARLIPALRLASARGVLHEMDPIMGADDFSFFRSSAGIPSFIFFFGANTSKADGASTPMNHSAEFAPEYQEAISHDVEALARSVIEMQSVN